MVKGRKKWKVEEGDKSGEGDLKKGIEYSRRGEYEKGEVRVIVGGLELSYYEAHSWY